MSDTKADNKPIENNKEKPGLSYIVGIVISLLAIVATIMVFIIAGMCVADKTSISMSDMSQEYKLTNQQPILIRDTLEYSLINYASNSTADNEPYSIFKQQELVGYIFYTFTAFLYVILFFIIGFVILVIWCKVAGMIVPTDDIRNAFPIRTMIVMGIALGAGFAFMALFKSTFQNRVQPTLKNIKYKIKKVNTDMYINMTDDPDFLNALVNSDIKERDKILNSKAQVKGLECLEKMIFTISLFEHLSTSVQTTDPVYTEIMKIFDRNNIQKQRIDITQYLKYGKPNIINNQYVASDSIKRPIKGSLTPDDETSLLSNINSSLTNINKSFHDLKILTNVKTELSTYLLYTLLAAIGFLIIIGIVFAPTIIEAVSKIYKQFKELFSKQKEAAK